MLSLVELQTISTGTKTLIMFYKPVWDIVLPERAIVVVLLKRKTIISTIFAGVHVSRSG